MAILYYPSKCVISSRSIKPLLSATIIIDLLLACYNFNCKETQMSQSQFRLFQNKACIKVACEIVVT